ncbi:MAG: hypothetical protein ACOYMA_11695 [Bacteroidia bacterium]
MRNIKIITVAFFIGLLCLNADCNKVEETPPVNEFFIIEGRLVNSCTDNSPKRNHYFILYDIHDYQGRIEAKTDSNGFFSINSTLKGKELVLEESQGKGILNKIPGGKSINFGDVAYNFTIPISLKFKGFENIKDKDSLIIRYSGGNPYTWKYIKGPLTSDDLGFIYIKQPQLFSYTDSIKSTIMVFINSLTNVPQSKNALVVPCGVTQEIIFE